MLCDWSRKIAPLHQPIEFKTNTNYDLVARVFPRSMGGLRNFNVDFHWLVTVSYFLPSGCCFWFWFWFYDNHQSKSALFTTESTGRLHYVFLVIIIVDIKRTKSIRVMNKLWKLPIEITSGSEYLNNVSVNQRICGFFFFFTFMGRFKLLSYEIIFWAGGRREDMTCNSMVASRDHFHSKLELTPNYRKCLLPWEKQFRKKMRKIPKMSQLTLHVILLRYSNFVRLVSIINQEHIVWSACVE